MCGCNVPIYHKERWERKNIFCSKKCEGAFRKSQSELNCTCEVCKKQFHRKQSWIDKNQHQYCSFKCKSIGSKELMSGENNHQYGLKGNKNPTWKTDEKISPYGYRLIRKLNHPYKNCDDFVFEHRLIAEQYLLTDENKVTINGIDYLSNDFHVHHLDFDRLNNSPDNLYVISKQMHMKFHVYMRSEAKRMNNNIKYKVEDMFTKKELIEMFYKFMDDADGGFGSTTGK